jgi:glucokinase
VLLDYIQKYYQKYAFKGCRGALFTLATLGNDAGIYGAARLVLK